MEEDIYKKSKFIVNKLIKYGFTKENDYYVYKKDIFNNEFEIVLKYKNNKIKGKVIDKSMSEELLNIRVKNNTGEFINSIKNEYIKILEDIRDNCCETKDFMYEQANTISIKIKEKYKVNPQFLWKDDNTAVFKNSKTNKWFGIIMNINKNKLDKEDKNIEVMNIKLDPKEINALVAKPGFYRAYHMNKKYWITIVLDNTISTDYIMELISKSYEYSTKK